MQFSRRSLLVLAASFLTWAPTTARPRSSDNLAKREIASYEEHFVNTRSYKYPNTTVKLIGCKKIQVPHDAVDVFEEGWHANLHEIQRYGRHFYDQANRELRIYFPVENALVQHGGEMIEANELGEFEVDSLDGDYAVLGRYQTDHVRGVDANIIKDGVIYLAEKVKPHNQIGNVFVYDFGYKDLDDHDHDHGDDGPKKRGCDSLECPSQGCIKNHDGVNCSKKFGIPLQGCTYRSDVCMDYNGWFTDCTRPSDAVHRILYFPGSDCDISMGEGHCYNEAVQFDKSL